MMQYKQLFSSYISRIWGNKTTIFLFFLNLITNSPFLLASRYHSLIYVGYWIVVSAVFSTIEGILIQGLKKIHLHQLFLGIIVFLHLLLATVDMFMYYIFKFIFNQDAVDIITQTTTNEAVSFLSTYLTVPFVISTILIVICLVWSLNRIATIIATKKWFHIFYMVLSLLGALLYGVSIKNYMLYNNGQDAPQFHAFTRAAYSCKVVFIRLSHIETLQEINSHVSATMPANNVNTIIFIIGESFSPYHSSLYGYNKETNPFLAKRHDEGSLTVFSDAVTISDHTEGVMSPLFSMMNRSQWYYMAPLFPTCFKAAGYQTIMLDNQYFVGNGISFLTDKKLSSMMFDYRNTDSYDYDGDMLQEMHITDTPQLIVLHLQGQHYTYSNRYPKTFAHFKSSDYNNLTDNQKEIVAHYDNATLYNDYVIEQIIKSVENKDCIVVYISDHGEELYELDNYTGHGNAALRDDPTYQIKVPLFIWTSEQFNTKHSDKAQRIKDSADKPILTTDLSHFLLDVADISTKSFNPEQSFINDHYKCDHRIILNTIYFEDIKRKPRVKSRYY